jgi:hypothetical protein
MRFLCLSAIRQAAGGCRCADRRRWRGASVIIFDCDAVPVDSGLIATAVATDAFSGIVIPLSPVLISRYFFGRRPADVFTAVDLTRLRTELRAVPHAAHALTWLRGPK